MKTKKTVAVEVSTKGRYFSTLPLLISSLTMQTRLPEEFHIFDDNEEKDRVDLRKVELYKDLFAMLEHVGIKWFVHFGKGIGQVVNHQQMLLKTQCDYILRVDDDNAFNPNTISTLLKGFDMYDNVGAVSSQIWKPTRIPKAEPSVKLNNISIGIDGLPAEWFKITKPITDAKHLYSTFMYDRNAAIAADGYPDFLSPVGHTEETQFSHRIYRAGYKLILLPGTVTWHFHNPEGGIRSYKREQLWKDDHNKFLDVVTKDWGYKLIPDKLVHLSGGLGDHYAFKSLLDDLYNKYKDHKIIISCAYPEVFEDVKDKYNLTLISNYEAGILFFDLSKYDVYKFMAEHNWTESLTKAYKTIYQI